MLHRSHVRILATFLTLFLVSGSVLIGLRPARALTTPENDENDDIFACNGVKEDALSKETQPPLSDNWPPANFSGLDFNFSFDPDQVANRAGAETDPPRANLVPPGKAGDFAQTEEMKFAAFYSAFDATKADQSDLSFSWSLNGTSLQGVVAGASIRDLPQSAGTHCSTVTRTPTTDTDHDGMDDNWERRYFVERGLAPNIQAVHPGDDFDHDGAVADQFKSADGAKTATPDDDFLINAPATSVGPAGSGRLTNLEEYIWGTDPTDPDTDHDGFSDGQDILGIGQKEVAFNPHEVFATGVDRFTMRITILGVWLGRGADDQREMKLDSSAETVLVGDSEQLEIALALRNTTPAPGDTFTVQAQARGTTALPDTLTYQWFINDVEQPTAAGQGAYLFSYTLPVETKPETPVTVRAVATNTRTGQVSEGIVNFAVGQLVRLDYVPTAVFRNAQVPIRSIFPNTLKSADYVFRWTLDGITQDMLSGPGATTFTLPVTKQEGDTHELTLTVVRRFDSSTLATITENIAVLAPQVSLTVAPTHVTPGSIVTVQATPIAFGSANLTYHWTLDEKPVSDVTGSQLSFSAGALGTRHTVSVEVQAVGGEVRNSATATTTITVDPTAASSSVTFTTRLRGLLAALIHSSPKVTAQATGFVLLAAVIFAILRAVRVRAGWHPRL